MQLCYFPFTPFFLQSFPFLYRAINRESTLKASFDLFVYIHIHGERGKGGGGEVVASVKQCQAKSDGCPPMGNLWVQCKKSSRRQGTWIRMKSGKRRERCPLFPIPNLTPSSYWAILPPCRLPEDIQRCDRIDAVRFQRTVLVVLCFVLRLLFDVSSLPRSNTSFLLSRYCLLASRS